MVRAFLRWCRGLPPRAKVRMAVAFGAGYAFGLITAIALVIAHWN